MSDLAGRERSGHYGFFTSAGLDAGAVLPRTVALAGSEGRSRLSPGRSGPIGAAAGKGLLEQLVHRSLGGRYLPAVFLGQFRNRLAHLLQVVGDDRPDGKIGHQLEGRVKYSAAWSGEPDSRRHCASSNSQNACRLIRGARLRSVFVTLIRSPRPMSWPSESALMLRSNRSLGIARSRQSEAADR